jgi:hypothetical protein
VSFTATVEIRSYCGSVVVADEATWPEAGQQLLDELKVGRGRLALIAAETPSADRLLDRLCTDLDLQVARIGAVLATLDHPPTASDVEALCVSATLLTDLDVLLWPALGIPLLPLLTGIARRQAVIAVWPGVIAYGRACYSTPGRPDYHDSRLTDVVVLRPRTTRFPDEVPYEIERIAQ